MYKKNTPINRKTYLSTNLINKLVVNDDDNDDSNVEADGTRRKPKSKSHHGSIKMINDSYKSLSQIQFDELSQPYIDYYTCREYNKKVSLHFFFLSCLLCQLEYNFLFCFQSCLKS